MNQPPIFPSQPVNGTKESLALFNAGILWNNLVGFDQHLKFSAIPPAPPIKPEK
ncbi:MAG: hypothetical protein ACLQKH_04460 [Steroidobacteraceae bacterium]